MRERAVLVEVNLARDGAGRDDHRDRLEELGRLADAAGAEVVGVVAQHRREPHPGTYVGQGKVAEIALLAAQKKADVIIFDNDLSPAQVRNLEREIALKVLDRTELILDIFATRARTHEARLQVELAQLEYTFPRLKQLWAHLGRIEGGIGMRGPGETQLETDRRLVRGRIAELRRKIQEIDRRKEREVLARSGALTVGIVGYTNAGKSSLLNALTGAEAYVADQLFATLDTRTRAWKLPFGLQALLSDTVGFIRDLPHHLVASFKATLEEAIHADLLLHVVDVSTEHVGADIAAVEKVLEEIGCRDKPQLVALNKADLVTDAAGLEAARRAIPGAVVTSCRTGQGMADLAAAAAARLAGPPKEVTIRAEADDGRLLAWIARHGEVVHRTVQDTGVVQRVRLPERLIAQVPHVAERAYTLAAIGQCGARP